MIDFNKTIQSDKIILRPITQDDFLEIKRITNDPNMWYYSTYDLSNETELKDWINRAVSELNTQKSLPL